MAAIADLVQQAVANHPGATTDMMYRILKQENPQLDPNAVSYRGVQGLSQITQGTWKLANPGKPYSLDPADQLNAQAAILAPLQKMYGSDTALVASGYSGGPGVPALAKKMMQDNPDMTEIDAIYQAASHYYQINPKTSTPPGEVSKYAARASGMSATSVAAPQPPTVQAYRADDSDPALAQPVSGMNVSADQLAGLQNAIAPPLIIGDGLGQEAWYTDQGIVRTRRPPTLADFPVTFKLFFDTAANVLPVTIALNASLRTHQRSMRHVVTKQRTLTGMLVNLWGHAPDQISGQGSTGLFLNQLGVSDFLSLSTVSPELQAQILKAFQSPDMNTADSLEAWMNSNEGFFRMAAKDAFVELLSLFKNNGTVWFRNENYTGYTTGKEQMGADAWSPQTGSTTFQNAARRNDVMTRGKVVLYFRNAAYYGYFKNLTFAMDATKPFRWDFNFVFQVESTVTNVSVPWT